MKYDEFLARVRERGEYKDNDEAAHVTNAVLEVLAQRISPGELNQIISQLPSSYAALFGKADLAG